jgi:protein required for attachment to host cells
MNKANAQTDLTNPDQWFIVANRASAEIYREGANHAFDLELRLMNPEGSMLEQNLDADRPGRGFSSAGGGTIHHGLDRRSDQHEEVARKFSKLIIRKVNEFVDQNHIQSMVLVAEPHFLGILKEDLSPKLKKIVKETINKEFGLKTTREMHTLLHGVLKAKRGPIAADAFAEDLKKKSVYVAESEI